MHPLGDWKEEDNLCYDILPGRITYHLPDASDRLVVSYTAYIAGAISSRAV